MSLREINKKTNHMQDGLYKNMPFTLTFSNVYLKLQLLFVLAWT